MSVVVRASIVLLCAAGIVVSIVSYRAQRNADEGFERLVEGHVDDHTRQLLEDGRSLNPDTRIELGLAGVAYSNGREWEPFMRRALDREPENVGLVITYSRTLAAEGRTADSQRLYDRASELDPEKFPPRDGGTGDP
jgi:hypothetical protein